MGDPRRRALIAAILAQLPDEAALKQFLQPWRPGAMAISPPNTPYPDRVAALVDDACTAPGNRWIVELVSRLVAGFPGNAMFAAMHLAVERDVVDAFPFPFALAAGQELVRTMAMMFPDEHDALDFAHRAGGVEPLEMPRGLSPLQLWRELLERTARTGETRNLVTAAIARFPRNPRIAFLTSLLDAGK